MKMNNRTFTSQTRESLEKYMPWRALFIGWKFDLIQKYINKKKIDIKISTKEKYGRFDISPRWWCPNYIREIVREIEEKTPYICIDCWTKLRYCYWWDNRRDLWRVLPRCTKCFKIKLKEREEIIRERELKQNELNTITEIENKNND